MTKASFFELYAVTICIAFFVGFLAPLAVAVFPEYSIHLPNRDYWLAPERRGETFAFFKRHFAWYGCAFLLTMVLSLELALRANLHIPILLPVTPILLIIFGFVAFNIFWAFQMFRRFTRRNG